jgi:hypothetical protein
MLTIRRFLPLLLLVALASGCDVVSAGPEDHSDFARARKRWEDNRPASYEFTLSIGCFCGPEIRRPVIVAVSGTSVVSRTYADNGTPYSGPSASSFPSIDGLLDIIAEARSRTTSRVEATYDGTLGYPVSAYIDHIIMAADDEIGYSVSSFRVR